MSIANRRDALRMRLLQNATNEDMRLSGTIPTLENPLASSFAAMSLSQPTYASTSSQSRSMFQPTYAATSSQFTYPQNAMSQPSQPFLPIPRAAAAATNIDPSFLPFLTRNRDALLIIRDADTLDIADPVLGTGAKPDKPFSDPDEMSLDQLIARIEEVSNEIRAGTADHPDSLKVSTQPMEAIRIRAKEVAHQTKIDANKPTEAELRKFEKNLSRVGDNVRQMVVKADKNKAYAKARARQVEEEQIEKYTAEISNLVHQEQEILDQDKANAQFLSDLTDLVRQENCDEKPSPALKHKIDLLLGEVKTHRRASYIQSHPIEGDVLKDLLHASPHRVSNNADIENFKKLMRRLAKGECDQDEIDSIETTPYCRSIIKHSEYFERLFKNLVNVKQFRQVIAEASGYTDKEKMAAMDNPAYVKVMEDHKDLKRAFLTIVAPGHEWLKNQCTADCDEWCSDDDNEAKGAAGPMQKLKEWHAARHKLKNKKKKASK